MSLISRILPSGGHVAAALVAVAALVAACTGSRTAAAFTPTFAAVKCPADVQGIVVLKVTCGYLTVLENRSRRRAGPSSCSSAASSRRRGTRSPIPCSSAQTSP